MSLAENSPEDKPVNENLEYIKIFAQFPFALRRFLNHDLTLDEAKRIIRERMEHREERFLRFFERNIYGYPHSPYLPLLRRAGCEIGDLRALVKQKGIEGALCDLREQDVYVTFEEFKGRKPIVRNGLTLPVQASDFDNPNVRRQFISHTSGSTGAATRVSQDFDHIAETAPYQLLGLSVRGLMNVPFASWSQSFPGGSIRSLLQGKYIGQMKQKWFTPSGWRDSKYWFKYDLATLYLMFWMRCFGIRVPLPTLAREDDARVIAHWAHDVLKTHRRCVIMATPSRALRICTAAHDEGLDLAGTAMRVAGEPITPAKAQAMRRAGVEVIPSYVMTETGMLSAGCLRPVGVDDVHLYKDAFALIAFPHQIESIGVTVSAFNITAFLGAAPKAMLNVQVDDYGIVEERSCGCEFESYGFTTHLREIRSYSKLVGEGVTLIGNEMLNVLEQVLPERFGGNALDYQLMEEEDEKGLTRLYLLIHPRVSISDENEVIQAIYKALSESSPMADAARVVWQNAQTLKIKRMEPVWTGRGKLMPLHIRKRTRS